MRREFMGMMLKPRCNRRSGWGKVSSTNKRRMSRSKIKVKFVVFFDWKRIVQHEFVPRVQIVNKQLYQEVLARLRDAVRRKTPELWENQTWIFISVINQLDAQNFCFTISLFHASTCFEHMRLDVALRQCAGSRVAPHPQLSVKISDIRCSPSTLFSGLSPSKLVPVSQT